MAQILSIASHLEAESILHPLSLGLGMWLALASIPLIDNMQTFEKCSCTENAASVGSREPVREAQPLQLLQVSPPPLNTSADYSHKSWKL